ncbi:MAG TPA: hypothetical protein PK179_02580 [Spirochaetales bacterium]|nr:hypothetical protein [Spirochaetales bacterium]
MGADALNRWRDALLVDRDDTAIAAAKRWLGPVRTPFNKHELIARLEAFLKKPETASAVVGLLDRTERRILALALYSGTAPTDGLPRLELAKLASDEPAFEASSLERIRSLHDRLALYSYRDGRGRERVAVAPPLLGRLAAELSPSDALSSAKACESPRAPDPFAAFCALVSACSHAKPAFKGRRELSKRASELLEAAIPGLAQDKERLAALLAGLEACGAFGVGDDGRPAAYPRRFVELCAEAGAAAPLALAAGCVWRGQALFGVHDDGHLVPATLRASIEALPIGLAYSPADLRRLCAMAIRRRLEALAAAGVPGAEEALDHGLAGAVSATAEALGRLGVVALGGDGLVRTTSAAAALLDPPAGSGPGNVIVEESHELRILPEADPATRSFIASVARLESAGLVWSAYLDKAAAKTAYAYGFRATGIAAELERLSGLPLPQSVRFSLDAWEDESRSARLRVGIVLALDGHLAGMLEHSPKAEGLVRERLADGVYLLAAGDAAEAERLLKAAGIDVDMRQDPRRDGGEARPLWASSSIDLSPSDATPPLAFRPRNDTLIDEGAPLVERLLAALDRLELPTEEKARFEAGVRARLVLGEEEFDRARAEEEPDSVGATDYPGKVRLLEKAMKEGSRVELDYIDDTGRRLSAAGVPRDIRRTSSGALVTVSTDNGAQAVIPIRAITAARRT